MIFGFIWLGFGLYAFLLAPPNQADTWELIQHLSTGNIADINPLIVALFNLMGVLPLMYACLLYADGRSQSIPAWVFATGSFLVGAFALLPYLALRKPAPHFPGETNRWIRFWDSRWLAGAIAISIIGLLSYGITQGNWQDFIQQWQTNRFIHVMGLDFCLLNLLFPVLLRDDMTRRGMDHQWFWAIALLPLLGAIGYLMVRPALTIKANSPQL